ncbi:18755_t:CDS:2, partial [Funneliformis geosporum]
NTTSDDSSILFWLDGFEKQLEEHELCIQQWENNIKKIIEIQVAEEYKRLKDEYDTLKSLLEKQQYKSDSDNLERQYKSRIWALDKSNVVKDKEISKLSAIIFQLKNDKNASKKDFTSAKKTIKVLDGIIYSKDQSIIAYNERLQKINPG